MWILHCSNPPVPFSHSECALAFMRWYMDARTAGAFAKAPWDMINHLAATISGARAYQHHLSGDLFVLTHIHLRVGILEVEELTHFVCALLVPLSQYGFPHNTTCERHASPWKFLPYGSFSQSTVFQRWYTRGRRGQLHRHRVEETVPLHRCCQG